MPLDESPPAVPFTCHVTAVLDVPETVGVNCWLALARTLADIGETVTPIASGGGGLVPDEPPVVPPQFISMADIANKISKNARRNVGLRV